MLSKEDYLKTLDKKRSGSGAIILNAQKKILMLKPTYKDYYEIPGGAVEKNESPIECCTREIKEEIGLEISVKKLLVLEYQQQEFDDCFMFVFYGGILNEKQIQNIKLQKEEIESFGFYTLEEIKLLTIKKLYNRIQKAVIEINSKGSNYCESDSR